jgi:hypothetical protein
MTGVPFDDADPEDGWDASDPVIYQLDNIAARLRRLLEIEPDIARVARLFDDLATIRARVLAGDLGL